MTDAKEAGVDGFIVVDLPPEEAIKFRNWCSKAGWVWSASNCSVENAKARITDFHTSLLSHLRPPNPA